MATPENKYEIIASGDHVLGEIWWNSSKEVLESDDKDLLEYIKTKHWRGLTHADGPKFLSHLGRILDNGYIHARKLS
jgi:hypothetical protein